MSFYVALHKAGVPAELHVFEKGPHGVGLALGDPALGEWPVLLANWLRAARIVDQAERRDGEVAGVAPYYWTQLLDHCRQPRPRDQ